jgi:hypothetical protein
MLTTVVQPAQFHSPIHEQHRTCIWTGQLCRRRSLWCRIRHCATTPLSTYHIAGQRQKTSNTSGV